MALQRSLGEIVYKSVITGTFYRTFFLLCLAGLCKMWIVMLHPVCYISTLTQLKVKNWIGWNESRVNLNLFWNFAQPWCLEAHRCLPLTVHPPWPLISPLLTALPSPQEWSAASAWLSDLSPAAQDRQYSMCQSVFPLASLGLPHSSPWLQVAALMPLSSAWVVSVPFTWHSLLAYAWVCG